VDEAWKQLPRAAVIVCASVLGSGSARAEQPEEASARPNPNAASNPDIVQVAPTCGPSCHGGVEVNEEIQPPPDEDNLPIAPTCGPSCHGGYEPDVMPPPVEPPPVEPAKKGCAVEDVDDAEPLGLAVLGLGLLVGAATRRRPES
jgi:MYXO-CTERM domain-containing protein